MSICSLVNQGLKYRALDVWNHAAHPTGLNIVYVVNYLFSSKNNYIDIITVSEDIWVVICGDIRGIVSNSDGYSHL
jgi:hypothetical protein